MMQRQSTKQPKISPQLNNCAVYLIVPELMKSFQYLADQEDGVESKDQAARQLGAHRADYELLKRQFEAFYKVQLTWKQLLELLKNKTKNNATIQQYILGPVLRQFILEKSKNPALAMIQSDGPSKGRYVMLDDDKASDYLYKPLGITVIHQRQGEADVIASANATMKAPSEMFIVTAHHVNTNHFERAAPEEQDRSAEDTKSTDCAAVAHVYQQLSENDDKALVEKLVNEQLKSAVKALLVVSDLKPVSHSVTAPKQELYVSMKHTLIQKFQTGEFDQKVHIDVKNIDEAKAEQGESDEDFAKRLQEAEFIRAGYRRK